MNNPESLKPQPIKQQIAELQQAANVLQTSLEQLESTLCHIVAEGISLQLYGMGKAACLLSHNVRLGNEQQS